jgi:hypothetical protein
LKAATLDSEPFALSDLARSIMGMNVWGSSCARCWLETLDLFRLAEEDAGGLGAVQIPCTNRHDKATCELVGVGGYLDPDENNFWGVQTFVRDGETIILPVTATSACGSFVIRKVDSQGPAGPLAVASAT